MKLEIIHLKFSIQILYVIRGYGLCVNPKHAGLDVGFNLILGVEKIAQAFGIKAFVVVCSNIRSQILSERIGFRLLKEAICDEFKDNQGQIVFPVQGSKSLKFGRFKLRTILCNISLIRVLISA